MSCNRCRDKDRDRDRDRNRNDVFGIQTFVDQDDFCRAVRRCDRRNDNVAGVSDFNNNNHHHCCKKRCCCRGFFW